MSNIVARTAIAIVAAVPMAFLATAAQAESGEYTAKYGWYAEGDLTEQEGGGKKFEGELLGTAFNTSGGDFADNMSSVCPMVNNISADGVMDATGTCTMTDTDGDTIELEYSCKGAPKCEGTFTFTGGTGKFENISGENDFFAAFVTASEGYSSWDGQYEY